jgi:flagellin
MRINHNIPALNAYHHLNRSTMRTSKVMEKLSSGLRINRAADDAAGLAISEKMKSQIRGLEQADRNILDGISLVQTAEGGLSSIHDMLQRMRELSVQAANDTLTSGDRQAIQQEIEQIKQGVNNIANNTEFNGIKLLNGTNPHPNNSNTSGDQQTVNVLSPEPVDSNGRLKFATVEGYPTTDLDNNKILIYGGGSTSYPSVRIDGSSYRLEERFLEIPTQKINGIYQTVYNVMGVEVTQSVRIVGQYKDKYEIRYEIKNISGTPKNIGFQYHIDTMLGDDDNAPFIINGNNVLTETKYTGSDIPNEFIVYNQNTSNGGNPEFQASGILKTTGEFYVIEEPSQFAIGRYDRVVDWDFSPNGLIGDSGYSIWWNERLVNNGESFTVNTYYGQSVPPTVAPPSTTEEGPYDIYLQVGANAGETFKVQLSDVRTTKIGIDNIKVDPREEAQEAISKIDDAIQKVSAERTKYGAYQNALEHIYNNVRNSNVNLTAAESRIADADMALEMAEFTKRNILNQSAQSMLSQANQFPQGILQLLKQ